MKCLLLLTVLILWANAVQAQAPDSDVERWLAGKFTEEEKWINRALDSSLEGEAPLPPPAAPSSLVLTPTSKPLYMDYIALSWTDNSTDEVTFRIERKLGAGGTYQEIAIVFANITKWYDDSVGSGLGYFYRIRAANASGNSAYATEQSATSPTAGTPTASLSVPATAFTQEVVIIDARASTNVCRRPRADGSPSVTIDYGDGFSKVDWLAAGHAFITAGTYPVTLTVYNCAEVPATTNVSITVTDIPAASGGSTITDATCLAGGTGNNVQTLVAQGSAAANAVCLQTAVDRAATRNAAEQEIVVPAGQTYAGPVYMTTPNGGGSGSKYITIKSSAMASLPPTKKRIVPATDSANMPIITAPSTLNITDAALETPLTAAVPASHHYRLQGLTLKKDSEANYSQKLLKLGPESGLNLLTELVHHFIVDRCWLDGGASDTSQTNNAIRMYGNYISVFDSELSPYRLIGAGVDSSAISLSAGQGPYAIWNTPLVAGSENFSISGGGTETNTATISAPTTTSATLSSVTNLELDQNIALEVNGQYNARQSTIVRTISGNNITFDPIPIAPDNGGDARWSAIPSYIEMRRNYLYKQLEWRSDDPSYNNEDTQIKNLWEAKCGRYIDVIGNIMRWTWHKDQDYAIVLAPRYINGCNSENATIRQVTFKDNIIRDAAKGLTTQATDYAVSAPTQQMHELSFRNNLWWNVGAYWQATGGQQIYSFNGASDAGEVWTIQQKRFFSIHDTLDSGGAGDSGEVTNFGTVDVGAGGFDSLWINGAMAHGFLGVFSNLGGNAQNNLNTFFPPGITSTDRLRWNKNLVVNGNGTYPSSTLLQSATWPTGVFNDAANGLWTIIPATPGKNAALDGTDAGVDMLQLQAAIGAPLLSFGAVWPLIRVISGDWTGAPIGPTVCKWHTAPACP